MGFSTLAATVAPEAVFHMLNELYARYDALTVSFGESMYKVRGEPLPCHTRGHMHRARLCNLSP